MKERDIGTCRKNDIKIKRLFKKRHIREPCIDEQITFLNE